jgi:hypothetical protein
VVPLHDKLAALSAKLRGLGHLIEVQGPHDPPIDLDAINYGLGLILTEMSEELNLLAINADLPKAHKRRKRQRGKVSFP